MKDQHPMGFVLKNLQKKIYEPMTAWLREITECAFMNVDAQHMPD